MSFSIDPKMPQALNDAILCRWRKIPGRGSKRRDNFIQVGRPRLGIGAGGAIYHAANVRPRAAPVEVAAVMMAQKPRGKRGLCRAAGALLLLQWW
jgi:hypothetical protein